MTANTMREAFEKWAVSEGMPITRGHYYDVYASAETRAAYLAWQAAQSVPVMGEPAAYMIECVTPAGDNDYRLSFQPSGLFVDCSTGERIPLYFSPTTSITAAELESLRKDAEQKAELERKMQHLEKTVSKLARYKFCMSYNDSYFTEPAGLVKRTVKELEHCLSSAMQERQP